MSEQKSVSETAETTALMRAVACYETDVRIKGKDYLAYLFLAPERIRKLTSELYRNAVKDAARNGLYEYVIARTAYFDDLFVNAIFMNVPQIVLLGAGYDTRAYRYGNLPGETKVFEVDAPFTQNRKTEILKTSGVSYDKVVFVSADFEKDDLFGSLIKNGYSPSRKTLYIWEGLTMYLTPESVDATLSAIVSNSAAQSVLSFDYVNMHIDDESVIIRKDEVVRFGMSPSAIEEYIRSLGYHVKKNIDFEDMNRLYLTCKNGEIFGNIKTTMNFLEVNTVDSRQLITNQDY